MAFKFRFESLKKHRKNLRDLAQREYAEAESAVRKQVNYIEFLYSQIDESNQKLAELRAQSDLDLDTTKSIEEFIHLQRIKIEQERIKARELLAVMEEKQEVLQERAKDFKIVERLREKDFQVYLDAQRALEAKEVDEINILRYPRSGS